MLNDGSAYVLFIILLEAVAGRFLGTAQVSIQLVRLVVGGPVVGFVCGWILNCFIQPVVNDNILESGVILTSVFFVYFLAERVFEVSAVRHFLLIL